MADDQSTTLTVAGIDLGPSTKNDSTGVLIARRDGDCWSIERCRGHHCGKRDPQQCNQLLVDVISGAAIVVIDAPLALGSCKPWERCLIECTELPASMKPSPSGNIAGHMWRAAMLRAMLPSDNRLFEIFPAIWFGLCDFDKDVVWKSEKAKEVRQRKRNWFEARVDTLRRANVLLDAEISAFDGDECDALPCIHCAILIAEGWELLRLDDVEPPVLFPPRELWDMNRLPPSVHALNWRRWGISLTHRRNGATPADSEGT